MQERKRKNGKSAYLIQFVLKGRRRSVFLGVKNPKRVAKEASLYVDELAKSAEFGLTLERRVSTWLQNIDDDLRERLGRAGLIFADKNVLIGELIELYMEAESPSMKRETISGKRVRFRQSEQRLDVADVVRFKARLDADFLEATRAGIGADRGFDRYRSQTLPATSRRRFREGDVKRLPKCLRGLTESNGIRRN